MSESKIVLEMQRTALKKEFEKTMVTVGVLKIVVWVVSFFSVLSFISGVIGIIVHLFRPYMVTPEKFISNILFFLFVLVVSSVLFIYMMKAIDKLTTKKETAEVDYKRRQDLIDEALNEQPSKTASAIEGGLFVRNDQTNNIHDIDNGAYKTCPMCAETVKAAAKICRFCRYEFENSSQSISEETYTELNGLSNIVEVDDEHAKYKPKI